MFLIFPVQPKGSGEPEGRGPEEAAAPGARQGGGARWRRSAGARGQNPHRLTWQNPWTQLRPALGSEGRGCHTIACHVINPRGPKNPSNQHWNQQRRWGRDASGGQTREQSVWTVGQKESGMDFSYKVGREEGKGIRRCNRCITWSEEEKKKEKKKNPRPEVTQQKAAWEIWLCGSSGASCGSRGRGDHRSSWYCIPEPYPLYHIAPLVLQLSSDT